MFIYSCSSSAALGAKSSRYALPGMRELHPQAEKLHTHQVLTDAIIGTVTITAFYL
jgi:hypothetical protein